MPLRMCPRSPRILVHGGRVLVALVLCSILQPVSLLAHPDLPVEIKDWTLIEDGVRLDLDLEQLRAHFKEQAPGLAREAAGDRFQTLTWGNFRFSNLRSEIDSIDLRKMAHPEELFVRIDGGIHADREKLHWRWRGLRSGPEWRPDGSKRIANLMLEGRIRLGVSPQSEVILRALIDSVAVESLLHPIRDWTFHQRLGGRPLKEQRIALLQKTFGDRLRGLRLTGIRTVEVTPATAVVDVLVTVDKLSGPEMDEAAPAPAPAPAASAEVAAPPAPGVAGKETLAAPAERRPAVK